MQFLHRTEDAGLVLGIFIDSPLASRLSFPHALPASSGSHGGSHIEVEGSFDNWTTRQVLQRSGKESTIVKLLPPGVYQVCGGGGGGACVAGTCHQEALKRRELVTRKP